MAAKIPATVVTGFLGAGKTTLIRGLLANARGRRIALIVNEFGDLGVDGEILKGCGDEACADEDVVELSNGCICCTVADDFLPTMRMLLDRPEPPEHIVIETSGLALPQPLVRAFNWPEIRTRVTVDGVVTLVDGAAVSEGRFATNEAAVERLRASDAALEHETPLSELFEDQLACADLIVVNKTDLIDEAQAAALKSDLEARSRPGVSVLLAARGEVDAAALLGLGVGAEADLNARAEIHHHHHDDHHHEDEHDHHHDHGQDHGHDAFESFGVERGEIADPAAFEETVVATLRAHGVLRLKGFAAVEGKPMRLTIQAVGPRVESYYDRPLRADEPRVARLVVIGEAGLDRDAIAAALGATVNG